MLEHATEVLLARAGLGDRPWDRLSRLRHLRRGYVHHGEGRVVRQDDGRGVCVCLTARPMRCLCGKV